MTSTLVLDFDEFTVTRVLAGEAETHRLSPSLHLGGLTAPGCRFVVLLPDTEDELGFQEAAQQLVAPYGRAVYSGRLAAVAAEAGTRGSSGTFLVCDLTPGGLYAGLAEVTGDRIRVDRRIREAGLGWTVFTEAVARALPGPPGLDGAAVAQALAQNGGRLAAALELAREDPAYADTPAAWVNGGPVDAGLLLDCFEPYARRVRAALSELGETAAPRALAGEFGVFSSLNGRLFGEGPEPLLLGPHAVVRGAAHLASGRFTDPEPSPVPLTLPFHRVKDGLLEESSVPIPSGPGEFASLGGAPLRLGGDVRFEDRTELVLEAPGRAWRFDLATLPASSYQVGLRVSRRLGTVLAFRAEGEAVPVFVPLENRT